MNKATIAIALVLVLTLLASCSSRTMYTIYEVGDFDNVSGSNHSQEFDCTTQTFQDTDVPNKKTITYGGTSYEAEYLRTEEYHYYNGRLNIYSVSTGDESIQFGINNETGRIDRYSYYSKDYLKNTSLTELSREKCLERARSYVATYVQDIGEYELVSEYYYKTPEFKGVYEFEFARVIGGIKTTDSAFIHITVHGTVITHVFKSLGSMKNAKLPSWTEMSSIQKKLNTKLESIYAPVKDKYHISYTMENRVFTRLKDGSYAMEYFYSVQLASQNVGTENIMNEMTHLVAVTASN